MKRIFIIIAIIILLSVASTVLIINHNNKNIEVKSIDDINIEDNTSSIIEVEKVDNIKEATAVNYKDLRLSSDSDKFCIFKKAIKDCPQITGEIELFEEYTLAPKRLFEFEHNNFKYSFTLGVVNEDEGVYIKDNNSKKIEITMTGSYSDNKLSDYAIGVYDFNEKDEDIQLIINWEFVFNDGPTSALYNINKNNFKQLGLMPWYDYITDDGKLWREIWWLNENVVAMHMEIENGELNSYIEPLDSSKVYTVNGDSYVAAFRDENGNFIPNEFLESGEKVHLISVVDELYLDCKIQRENGDIVIVGQTAGRT